MAGLRQRLIDFTTNLVFLFWAFFCYLVWRSDSLSLLISNVRFNGDSNRNFYGLVGLACVSVVLINNATFKYNEYLCSCVNF